MNKVYCITNKINNKKYVGFTSMTIPKRMGQHRHKAKNEKKQPIHLAINKYGWENFDIDILYEGEDALDREDSYIKQMGDYNITPGGSANQKGRTWKWSEEQKLNVKGKIGRKPGCTPWNKGLKTGPSNRVYKLKPVEELTYSGLYMRDYNKGIKRRK